MPSAPCPMTPARAELCRLAGVGEKVANCVLLFAYRARPRLPHRCLDRARPARKLLPRQAQSHRVRLRDFSLTTILVNSAVTRSNISSITPGPRAGRRKHDRTHRRNPLPARDRSAPAARPRASTAVVFDVLRATSTMITALAHGAAGIRPVRTIEEAWDLKQKHPAALLGGERHGDVIQGFDLGNSPSNTAKTSAAAKSSAPPPMAPSHCAPSSMPPRCWPARC